MPMNKKAFAAALAAMMLFAGCSKTDAPSETTSNEEYNDQMYAVNLLHANQNAEELLGYAEEYAVMCIGKSGKMSSGRYAGRVYISKVELEDVEYTGRQEDLEKYLSYCASSQAWSSYYAVMITDGMPTACYTSDQDISGMDFSKYKKPENPTATSQVIGQAEPSATP